MKKRLAAEWEPIKGVMIAWPAFLPHAYIVDLTQNYHVYLCVPGQDEENNAKKHLTEWGGNIRNVTFCQGPQGFDAPWVRDWECTRFLMKAGTSILLVQNTKCPPLL